MQVTVRVDQIKLWAYHGVYEEEQVLGGHFLVDVALKVELSEEELLTDELSSTYNYEMVVKIVEREMNNTCALLEKKAVQMARAIQSSDPRVKEVQLRLTKLRPHFKTEVGATSVEILL